MAANIIYSPGTNIGPGVSDSVSFGPPVYNQSNNNYQNDIALNSARRYSDYESNIEHNERLYNKYLEKSQNYNYDLWNSARDYYTEMSNTAIQRQVKDLIAAGINPVLAANLGGAPVMDISPPYMSISPTSALGSIMSSGASYYASDLSYNSAQNVANIYSKKDFQIAEMANANAVYIHNLDNSAKSILEHSLQNNKIKFEYDQLTRQIEHQVEQLARSHNYDIDKIDQQTMNNIVEDYAKTSKTIPQAIERTLQNLIAELSGDYSSWSIIKNIINAKTGNFLSWFNY